MRALYRLIFKINLLNWYCTIQTFRNISTENLQYLNADQALADLAYFIETKKKEKHLEKSTVIVVGGSYAGNMAAWARLKYPHLIQVLFILFSYLYIYILKIEKNW